MTAPRRSYRRTHSRPQSVVDRIFREIDSWREARYQEVQEESQAMLNAASSKFSERVRDLNHEVMDQAYYDNLNLITAVYERELEEANDFLLERTASIDEEHRQRMTALQTCKTGADLVVDDDWIKEGF